jgi:hypothetical protein
MSIGCWVQNLSLLSRAKTVRKPLPGLPVNSPTRKETEDAWVISDPLPATGKDRPPFPCFLFHLPLSWNFIILFKLLISLLWDLISKAAAALVKLLWQWFSNQKHFVFWWEFGNISDFLAITAFFLFYLCNSSIFRQKMPMIRQLWQGLDNLPNVIHYQQAKIPTKSVWLQNCTHAEYAVELHQCC